MAPGLDYDPEKCTYSLPSSPVSASLSSPVSSADTNEPTLVTGEEVGHHASKEPRRSNWSIFPFKCGAAAHDTICRTLEGCPLGYPRLAAFLSSDHSFTLYRGFSYLHARVLLMHQDELVELERELDQLDREDAESGRGNRLKSRARDKNMARKEKQERPRETVLNEIREKLMIYDEVLKNAREVGSFQKPSERDYRSVRTWFENLKPLVAKEKKYIECREDIVALRNGRECAGFDGFVESMLQKLDGRVVRWLFCTKELREKTSDEYIHYYSPSRIDKLVGLIITSVIFVLLVAPVVAMYRLTSFGNRDSTFRAIGILIVFTLLFSAAMSLLTRARRHELFAASAAYCAVLVVFISNFGTLPS